MENRRFISTKENRIVFSVMIIIVVLGLTFANINVRILMKYPITIQDELNDIQKLDSFDFTKFSFSNEGYTYSETKDIIDIQNVTINHDGTTVTIDLFLKNLSSYISSKNINVLLNFSTIEDFHIYTEISISLSDSNFYLFHSLKPNILEKKIVIIPLTNRISFTIPQQFFLTKSLSIRDFNTEIVVWEEINNEYFIDYLTN